jgi:hypothetical protein
MTRARSDRPFHRRPALAAGLRRSLVAIVLAVATFAAMDALAKPPEGGAGDQTYAIVGDVDDVVPGRASTLAIRLDNPNRFSIEVRTLDVAVGDAAAGCVSSNLVVGLPTVPVTIPARGTTSVDVPVGFVDDPADACQGAEFPLTYEGSAVRLRR